MIDFQKALRIIHATAVDYGTEEVSLDESVGRILRESLYADRDFPPFNRVTMDGIAIRYETFRRGARQFPIAGIAAAGAPEQQLVDDQNCLEVMTGAMLPQGTDTVIRYEDLEIKEGVATIQTDVKAGQNIHRQGEDRGAGGLLAGGGKVITAAEIGIAATVGKTHLKVARHPKTIIISTGDELVDVGANPLPHQIRRSNSHSLHGVFARIGMPVDMAHLDDDYESILTELRRILADYEIIILSGGVSKGKFDYLPKALEELGIQKHFHRILQRPGKPFWFGTNPDGDTHIFALPGNPVSSFMCTTRYIIPWLERCMGQLPRMQAYAMLQQEVHFKPDLTLFLQVRIDYDEQGHILAIPVQGNGSGDLASLTNADAFIQLPRGQNIFAKGEVHPIFFYR